MPGVWRYPETQPENPVSWPNTTPSLTFRFEAEDEGALEGIKARFRDLLRRVAPDMQAPF